LFFETAGAVSKVLLIALFKTYFGIRGPGPSMGVRRGGQEGALDPPGWPK